MKVRELIEELQQQPADARVLFPGYEDDWDEVENVKLIPIRPNPRQASYYGEFQECDEADAQEHAVRLSF